MTLAVQRVAEDFFLPSPSGSGTPLSQDELHRRIHQLSPSIFFSQELCARYFTYMSRETGAHFTIPYQFIQVHFPGTGDMFSAVLVGELLGGTAFQGAVRRAMDVLETLIRLERDEAEKNKGIRIEKYLSVLNQ